jgi:prepilin-type N-terminal cleavage/methylation domain-containing protein
MRRRRSPSARRARANGFSLPELVIVLALLGLALGAAGPAWSNIRSRISLQAASSILRGELRELRSQAVCEGRHVGWRTWQDGRSAWWLRPYRDGDGDGLRSDDIREGIDEPAGPAHPALPIDGSCRLGFPTQGVPDPSAPSVILRDDASPFRFGVSGLVSFSPLGDASPGSIFLTDSTGRAWCLRLTPGSGRPHLLRWEPSQSRWLPGP